jgi:hypothetical protein
MFPTARRDKQQAEERALAASAELAMEKQQLREEISVVGLLSLFLFSNAYLLYLAYCCTWLAVADICATTR